jgi:hypothetical protein
MTNAEMVKDCIPEMSEDGRKQLDVYVKAVMKAYGGFAYAKGVNTHRLGVEAVYEIIVAFMQKGLI